MRCLRIGLIVMLGALVVSLTVRPVEAGAEAAPLTVAYGNGVHAYNDGDYQCSYDELSSVIEAGSNDPRAFYFRGLAALKLGRVDEAEADFEQGANLEADGHGGRGVARALERVQGCDRLKLEHYRSRARVAALQRDREAVRQRYSDIHDAEADVLRRRRPEAPAPAEGLRKPAPKSGAPAAEEPAEKPLAEEATEKPARESREPAAEPPTDTIDPFADEPAGGAAEPAEPL